MEKKMIIAIVLSLAVLLGFQVFGPKKTVRRYTPQTSVSSREAGGNDYVTGAKSWDPAGAPSVEKPLQENTTGIQTDKYELVFSDIGGSLKKLSLNEYQEKGKGEILIDEKIPAERPFAMQSGLLAGLERRKYKLAKKNGMLEYHLIEPDLIEITKKYIFHKSLDCIGLDISIKNLSPRNIVFSYHLTSLSGLEKSSRVAGRNFLQADTMIDGKVWKTKSVKGAQERTGHISWTALKNRYFALILKPLTPPESVTVRQSTKKTLMTGLNSRSYDLAPGEKVEDKYLLYAGPLSEERIAAVSEDMKDVVDYGFFGGVSKVLLSTLRFFHRWVKNWGVAIILLTLLINAILFPLTYKSFMSMQQMKQVQPHLQKLKELHKDNPQKLNKETMELYKKFKVNPLGGCLPMLLQMPIFIALYQGLMRSVELKGAHFLWIKDLAKPDAVPLPVSLPFIGSSINILPILMAGVMVLQQKLSQGLTAGTMTKEQASQQKMMMMLMPVLFGFLFYKMPSGLVLYWLTNTILMAGEQNAISRRMSGK